jgi:toxin YoeB
MKISWTATAWNDYLYWQEIDRKMLQRINQLIKEVSRTPFSGIGKPEPLKFYMAGKWSRRIDAAHRLVYQVVESAEEDVLVIFQCRYHY